ncbi:Gfo/Idh/MocA family oxidoreductase [bacterium]|nr:Gfo/Idh/MocA family oxidoreductase [bacterium]
MATPLRLGIVGCGAVVRDFHLPALRQVPAVVIRVLCDTHEASARLLRTQFGLEAVLTTRVGDLAGQVDAAVVAVPPRLHAPLAIELLEAGVHVWCEKPLATSAAAAQRMVDTAAAHDRLLAVGLVFRFHPNNQLLREVLADGILGELRRVEVEFGAPLDWPMTTPWYYSRQTTAGGVFFEAGIHMLDRAVWLFGDLEVESFQDDSYGGFEANGVLAGRFHIQNRAVPARVAASWTDVLRNSIRVVGSAGTAEVALAEPDVLRLRRRVAGQERVLRLVARERCRPLDAYVRQHADFADAVRTRRAPLADGAGAVPALQVIERAYAIRQRLAQPWVETPV